ncbi:MAG: non-hydrolyzing UDP-N-acetylglucosamine 2-epimerase [Armatimonadota bacterium]
MTVFGTRPEAVKMAPVIRELKKFPNLVELKVAVTAQHREMLDQVLKVFDIVPDYDLNIMQHGQSLADITTRSLQGLDRLFAKEMPDLVLVQGDALAVLSGALAAFYHKIPVGHVEAGLRTGEMYNPFPEEMVRRLTSQIASMHFAPTEKARANLLAEGIPESNIFVTGNTVIDALLSVAAALPEDQPGGNFKEILVTAHRRENWGEPHRQVFLALRDLVEAFPDVRVVFAMHRNPEIRRQARSILGGLERVELIEPPDYAPFVALMKRCYMVITDSGGIQEEAPSLGKPVLVVRSTTERPEGVEAGTVRLVGTNRETVFREASRLLTDPDAYQAMAKARNPYGDGRAAERIREAIFARFLK